MPRSVGHSKLTPLLALNPVPSSWVAADLKAKRPAGLSEKTIDAIVDAIPSYLAWKEATGLSVSASAHAPAHAPVAAPATANQMTVVFTGVRDKALEATLQAKGHIVADAVTKKTTHLVHADGAAATSTKLIKAQEMGITILSLSDFKHLV
jgi:NAD-dependent DNA ligase